MSVSFFVHVKTATFVILLQNFPGKINQFLLCRGFYCDDQALKHPYLEQSVPITLCITIWALASIICIVLVETLRAVAEKGR